MTPSPLPTCRNLFSAAAICMFLTAGCATQSAPPPHAPVPESELRTAGIKLYDLSNVFETDSGAQLKLSELRGRRFAVAMFDASRAAEGVDTFELLRSLEDSLPPSVRERTGFVLIARDPARDGNADLAAYRAARHLSREHWILLRGSPEGTKALTDRLAEASPVAASPDPVTITVIDDAGRVVDQRTGLHSDLSRTLAALKGPPPAEPHDRPAVEVLANLPMGL